jgi:hypothetical protein
MCYVLFFYEQMQKFSPYFFSMNKRQKLTLAGIIGISTLTNAGSLEELKHLLSSKETNLNLAVAGYYFYTSDRNDTIEGKSDYSDIFSYSVVIGLYKEATEKSPYGFGISFGQAWFPVVGSEPFPKPDDANGAFSDSNNNFGLFEAYAEVQLSSVNIKAGRFLTNIGGEAPFTWQNVNIQRGLVWAGEPVWYDGIRISTQLGSFSIYAGVNDRDTDDGKMAFEGGIAADLPYKTSASFNVLIPDKSDEWNTKTYNLTFNINYFENFPITLYADYLNTPQKGEDADSIGVSLLGEYKFDKKLSLGGRIEYLHNDGDGDNYGIGTGNYAWTYTLTPKYQINKYLSIRAETSYVKTGKDIYRKNDKGDLKDSEFRAGLEVAFVF